MQTNFSLPTILTWVRVALVPIFVLIYYLPDTLIDALHKDLFATLVFILAAFTDYLDGYLARKLKQESSFGAFLDPVADKAIVAAALILLVHLDRTFVFAAIIIIVREIAISALREWMAQVGHVKSVAVHFVGKLKTTLQFVAITLLLFNQHTNFIGNILMLLAVIITIVSMLYYLEQAKKYFKNHP